MKVAIVDAGLIGRKRAANIRINDKLLKV